MDSAETHHFFACICCRLLHHITADWANVVPHVLGELLPIVRALPPDRTLYDCYYRPAPRPTTDPYSDSEYSQTPEPPFALITPIPLLLSEVVSTIASLQETHDVPSECDRRMENSTLQLSTARDDYQRAFSDSQRKLEIARYKLIQACCSLHSSALDAEMRLMERQAKWDDLVRLLRGRPYFAEHFEFESRTYLGPDELCSRALPDFIRSNPL